MLGFLYLSAAAALLTVGAELFAEHAAGAGRRVGVSALAVGLVLGGAEPEELVTAIVAALHHRPAIAAGDAVGANVTMLTVVLGLAALARPLRFPGRVRTYALAASAAGLAAATLLSAGDVGAWAGGLLVGLYLVAVGLVWRHERQPPAFGEAAEVIEQGRLPGARGNPGDSRAALAVLVGVVGMAAGGRLAVAGAERVVGALGLHDSVVGLTFVALATTAELFALVWAAARRDVEDLALAGVMGSATYNATATLGAAALIHPVPHGGLEAQAWLAAAIPILLVGWALAFGRVGRVGGAILVLVYGGFLGFTFSGH